MPAGRPTLYVETMCDTVRDLGKLGKSKAQIASALGINRDTLREWGKDRPEFSAALKEAQDLALSWWEDEGQAGLKADKFNAVLFIFQMKNRFRDDYRDKQEVEHSGGVELTDPYSDLDRAKAMAALLAKVAQAKPE